MRPAPEVPVVASFGDVIALTPNVLSVKHCHGRRGDEVERRVVSEANFYGGGGQRKGCHELHSQTVSASRDASRDRSALEARYT